MAFEWSNKVTLEYEEDVRTIIHNLEKETGMSFVEVYSPNENKSYIVPINIKHRKIHTGKPITEEYMKQIAPKTYAVYKSIKKMRKEMSMYPKEEYYIIKIGDIIFGGNTINRGRIKSKQQAISNLISITLTELWNYDVTRRKYKGKFDIMWQPIMLLYFKRQDIEPEVIVNLDTYEKAIMFVGKDVYEEYVNKIRKDTSKYSK